MAILSKRKTLVLGAVIIVGAAAGAGGYLIGKSNEPKIPKVSTTSPLIKQAAEAKPDSSASTGSIIKNLPKYNNKPVKAYGLVMKVAENKYILSEVGVSSPQAIELDFNGSGINPDSYTSGSSSTPTSKTRDPKGVTVSGTVVLTPSPRITSITKID